MRIFHKVYLQIAKEKNKMTDLSKKFAHDALLLSREDIAGLVDKLLGSLNAPIQEEINRLWSGKAEKRVK
jgi:hypothetical protein